MRCFLCSATGAAVPEVTLASDRDKRVIGDVTVKSKPAGDHLDQLFTTKNVSRTRQRTIRSETTACLSFMDKVVKFGAFYLSLKDSSPWDTHCLTIADVVNY